MRADYSDAIVVALGCVAMVAVVSILPTAVAIWGEWASAYAVECKEAAE